MHSRSNVASGFGYVAALCLGLYACGGDSVGPVEQSPAQQSGIASITVTPTSKALLVGEWTGLGVRSYNAAGVHVPTNPPPIWASSDDAVARVAANGQVTAVGVGTATIRATVGDKTASADITVAGSAAMLAVSASKTDVCGITTAGVLHCAGKSHGASPTVVAPDLRFKAIKGFGSRVDDNSGFCAITTDDSAYCWGSNGRGQLGVGDTRNRTTPALVSGGLKFRNISPGDLVTCGVTLDGAGYCWGAGDSGAIGDGATVDRSVPTRVRLDEPLRQISAGNHSEGGRNGPNGYACAITERDQLYCWGGNTTGQLADGKVPLGRNLPQPAASHERFQLLNENNSIIACALSVRGDLYCWGNANPLRMSTSCPFPGGGVHPCLPVPTRMETPLRFTTMTASANGGMCGTTTSREIACWGLNLNERFGMQGCETGCGIPSVGHTGYISVSSSVFTTCGIAVSQRAYCWGDNSSTQFADALVTTTSTPMLFRVPAAP